MCVHLMRASKDELFLKELVDSLAMSGIANEIAGSSAPTSGSEHLISHALDKILEHPQLHGIQVGIATYIMSVVQNHRYVRVCTVLKRTGLFRLCGHSWHEKAGFSGCDRYGAIHEAVQAHISA